jgi:DNA-binding MarR family transcriptional regulator
MSRPVEPTAAHDDDPGASRADPSPPDRHVTLIAQFRQISRQLVAELTERLHAAGYEDVTPSYQAVFENIDRQGTRLTVLATRAEMTHPSMSELVTLLERRGYVERRPDPSDRRVRLVSLTEKGRQAVRAALAASAEIEVAWNARAGEGVDWRSALERGLTGRTG